MLFATEDSPELAAPVALPAAAFLFVDIVGFTAFTEEHGDAAAADLAWRLRTGVERELCAEAHVVKLIGDAVMVRIADPAEAIAAGARIAARALPHADDPAVHVGLHFGPAIERAGDFFGAAVNVAARVAALARPGEVLVTDDLVLAARARSLRRHGVAVEELGERVLRNVAVPVLLYQAELAPSSARQPLAQTAGMQARALARRQWARAGIGELANV